MVAQDAARPIGSAGSDRSAWAAVLNTARWLVRDQRKLIREGFGDADAFETQLMLPVYDGKHLSKDMQIRRRRLLFTRDPADFAAVFQAPLTAVNAGAAYSFLKPYFGDQSVFVMEGDRHLPAKQAVFRALKSTMQVEEDDLLFFHYSIKEIFRPGIYAVLAPAQYVSSAFVIRTIFGEQGTALADATIKNAMSAAANASGAFLLVPSLLRWTRSFGIGLQIRRQRLQLRQFILDQIGGTAFADHWPGAKPEDLPRIRMQVVDNLMTLLIAGFETSGVTVSWLLYELAVNQQVQSDLRAEIAARLHDDPEGYLSDDDSLLAACVFETLRLHPSIPFVIRQVVSDFPIGGRVLSAGDYIILSIEELHKKGFGPDSAEFVPARYARRREFPKLATFGGGAKACPGRAIAVQQVRAIGALLIATYLVEPVRDTVGRIQRDRISASPVGGMVLSLQRIM